MADRDRSLGRRTFLKTLALAGGVVAASPLKGLAGTRLGGVAARGAARTSSLAAAAATFLVHSDLHNHSLISGDADGDPYTAYAQMRERGIDVACLTEHAISGKDHNQHWCAQHQKGGCRIFTGINENDWALMEQLADAAYEEGTFVALRGFEWSTPTVGHLNVWFSERYTDALHEHAFITPRAIAEVDRVAPVPSEVVDRFEQAPETATMRFFYDWLAADPDRPVRGGGNDGIACFNHPNEFGDFEAFVYDAAVAPRVVSIEALNADRDFFWYRRDEGMPNPFNACLNAGWRVGFTGVSDEHGTRYAREGMARGGLWVTALTREAVREALVARRSFATVEAGLRVHAVANGVPMGSVLAHDSGPVTIALDIDGGPALSGVPIVVEVMRPGSGDPVLAAALDASLGGGPITLTLPVDREDGAWMFLRVTRRDRPADPLAIPPFDGHGAALAYASPWFLAAP